ncbi:MAG TPA: hypothetical protein PKC69_07905 [Chitinophagaceae bacterium]|nr:hypothetical protein [Chitinophagaceae bacterium]
MSRSEIVDETATRIKVEDGRLVFENYNSFYETLNNLRLNRNKTRNLPEDTAGFNSLGSEFAKVSLLIGDSEVSSETNDLLSFGFPEEFLLVLNKEGEVQIGNEIIWYQNHNKFFISTADKDKLKEFKKNTDLVHKRVPAGSQVVDLNFNNNSGVAVENLTYLGYGGSLDARHQREFVSQAPVHGRRKYVHEIITFFDGYYNTGTHLIWSTYITLRIKLEWKGSKWRPASELRNINVSLSGTASVNTPGQGTYQLGPTINTNQSVQRNNDYLVPLAQFNGSGTLPGNARWQLNMWGTIYHHIVGDVTSNQWYNAGTSSNPLW